MLKFFRNILNTYKSKKLSNFIKDNSIDFSSRIELDTLFREYLEVLKLKDNYSSIAKKFTNGDKFNIYAKDFIVEYSQKNELYNIVQNVKTILDSDSDLTYYNKIYPHARETVSTQRSAVDSLRENINKIDQYVSECERLKLEVGTCIDE